LRLYQIKHDVMYKLLKNVRVVNRGKIIDADVLIKKTMIERIESSISPPENCEIIDCKGLHLIPGIIDDQVHFREPGLMHKATIATESRAAVAGGVTSFMEMPNVIPTTTTQILLEEKYAIGAKSSLANYSFFFGATNNNFEEVMLTSKKNVCGVKIFMGSSTGNMLVDNNKVLEKLFGNVELLIATHCESETMVRESTERVKNYIEQNKFNANAQLHPFVRPREACYASSQYAINLAKKLGTRLHVLHISTADEIELFDNSLKLSDKKITAEACVHHLFFDEADYAPLGNKIKCNPSIKTAFDREQVFRAVLNNSIDVIATDHAPHTLAEKQNSYFDAPSGLPLVQHGLQLMLSYYHYGAISLERIVEKMCHAPAECFKIPNRGFINEGYKADLVLLDVNKSHRVNTKNIFYKCGWSPLEGETLKGEVVQTFVNGNSVYKKGKFEEKIMGERLTFAS